MSSRPGLLGDADLVHNTRLLNTAVFKRSVHITTPRASFSQKLPPRLVQRALLPLTNRQMVWPFSSWKKEPVKITETAKDSVDLLILVLGLSGDGKSTFINTAAGDCIVKTSNELDPLKGTSEVEDFRKECEGLKVAFIDTPGLDSEETTLSSVYAKATSILTSYDRTHADAIVYLHDATRKVVTEPPKTGDVMKKFQTLCGPSWKKRVIFAVSTRTNDGREEIVSGVKDLLKKRFYPEIEAMGFSPSNIADAWQIINKAVKSDPPT